MGGKRIRHVGPCGKNSDALRYPLVKLRPPSPTGAYTANSCSRLNQGRLRSFSRAQIDHRPQPKALARRQTKRYVPAVVCHRHSGVLVGQPIRHRIRQRNPPPPP